MAFDWLRFLEQHRIEYNASGANTSRDNVVVHCPFCGHQDPSKHMSVNLVGKGFRCWRNPTHRGKNPARLVQAMIGCTYERASQIVGNAILIPTDFMARVRDTINPPPPVERRPLKMPAEFKRFTGLPSSKRFVRYLHERNFTDKQIERMSERLGVRYCTRGPYEGRIMFPLRFEKRLLSWTGRTIYNSEELRYKTLSIDPERTKREGYEAALGAISHYLLWYDVLKVADADTVFLCEGPFDALKVMVLGAKHGVVATCFFTAEPTEPQVNLLHEVLPRFKRRFMLLDRGTFATGIRVTSGLSSLGVVPASLPHRLKDPGEFTVPTFDQFLFALRRRPQ